MSIAQHNSLLGNKRVWEGISFTFVFECSKKFLHSCFARGFLEVSLCIFSTSNVRHRPYAVNDAFFCTHTLVSSTQKLSVLCWSLQSTHFKPLHCGAWHTTLLLPNYVHLQCPRVCRELTISWTNDSMYFVCVHTRVTCSHGIAFFVCRYNHTHHSRCSVNSCTHSSSRCAASAVFHTFVTFSMPWILDTMPHPCLTCVSYWRNSSEYIERSV